VAIALGIAWLLGSFHPLRAETQLVVIDLPLSGGMSNFSLVTDSEQRIASEINRHFSQSSSIDTLQVSVLAHRNGEVIPLMTTVVSRDEWRQLPQVNAWTRYHTPQSLLARHDQERVVSIVPLRPDGSSGTGFQDTAQLDRQLDAGRLSGRAAQDRLSDLD
jgi:hypothetical protein